MLGCCGLRVAGGLASPGFRGARDVCEGAAELSESELGCRPLVTCGLPASGSSGVVRSSSICFACCADVNGLTPSRLT